MSDKMRRILIIICSIVMFIYLLPLFINGIFNEGTFAGVCISGVILLIAIFNKKILELKKKKIFRRLFNIFISLLLVFLLVFTSSLIYVVSGTINNTNHESTVIVLGCAVHGDRPSRPLYQRINRAYMYLEENDNAVAILSGGQGADEDISEAQCMYNILTEKGIDASRLYIEDKSTSTFENIRYSKKIITDNNLSEDVVVVTNDYHIRRAEIVTKNEGLNPKRCAAFSDLSPVFYTRDTMGVWATLLYYIVHN